MSKKQPPRIAKNTGAKTADGYTHNLGDIAFGKNRRINGKEVKEEDIK